MARKDQLRKQRTGTVINLTSSKQEARVGKALQRVISSLEKKHPFSLKHQSDWMLQDIVGRLKQAFPEVTFHCHFDRSSMRPDGGILSLVSKTDDTLFPILITEVKNQGTNDLRVKEGLKRQARGNAIERLGKNVIGFRAALRTEGIVPFLCFGDGCDFESDSSILDRVTTIAMFGPLNKTHVVNIGPNGIFNRGSFYFRPQPWTVSEMAKIMLDVAQRSIHYYLARYGEDYFQKRTRPAR
jgi:type II restriction enzyme